MFLFSIVSEIDVNSMSSKNIIKWQQCTLHKYTDQIHSIKMLKESMRFRWCDVVGNIFQMRKGFVVFQMRPVSPINRQNGNHLFRFVSTEFDLAGWLTYCEFVYISFSSFLSISLPYSHSRLYRHTHTQPVCIRIRTEQCFLHQIYLAMACSNKWHQRINGMVWEYKNNSSTMCSSGAVVQIIQWK